ncbi:C1 family peptidase [Amycolatopsis sp. NPDC059090]|uniref:C1 family peptidase n=1 Tax=unclassified Amycolatopsis TaxID=2618356 RepID=UPI003671F778
MSGRAAVLPRAWFPPVLEHSDHPTCTAAVVTAMAGYHLRRRTGLAWTPSVLFNYFTSRAVGKHGLLRGSRLDWAFAAWHRFGLPSEEDWPFDRSRIDQIPSKASFLRAKAFRGIGYRRLDDHDSKRGDLLGEIRGVVSQGAPVSLEFPLNPAQQSSWESSLLPMLPRGAERFARHVVLVVGYEDDTPAGVDPDTGEELTGALIVRNSWGTDWGDGGYGRLPYQYCRKGLTRHHWTVELSPVRAERKER